MNRLTSASTLLASPAPAVARAQRPQLHKDHSAPPHCLLAPQHYEKNYAYPLVVWLHPTGGDERELRQVMPLISLRNYASAAVRGPAVLRAGYDWPQTLGGIGMAETRVAEAASQAKLRFNVHDGRVYLLGYEAGGTMAIRLALRNPRLYAGAVSLNGPFPAGHAPLARLPQLRQTRILISHCRDSETYTTDRICRELALFHAAGMSATLRQYPCSDELTTQMLSDVDGWLMEQITGERSDAEPQDALPGEWN